MYGDTYDDSSDGGSSQLIDSILSSATQLGQTAILANSNPNLSATGLYAPPRNFNIVNGQPLPGTSSGTGILWVVLALLAAVFVLPRLIKA